MPHAALCLGRLPQPVSQTTKRCVQRLSRRVSAAVELPLLLPEPQPPFLTAIPTRNARVSRRLSIPSGLDSACDGRLQQPVVLPYQTASDTRCEGVYPLMVPHEVPPVQERAYTRPSSTHAIRCARWHPELAVGGQGRGEDFTPSGRPPMGGWRRPRTTRLDLDASVHDQMVAVRSTRRVCVAIWRQAKDQG